LNLVSGNPDRDTMNIPVHQLGFDFDGVIADTAEAFIRIACEKYGYCSFTKNDITSFDIEDCLSVPTHVLEEIFTDILKDSIGTGVQPIPGAVETLEYFTSISTVTIITARSRPEPVHDWLELFFRDSAHSRINVVVTGDHDDKVRHIHSNKLKFFIDDRAETCSQLAKENITPFVFSQPWNNHAHQLKTVNSWQEIMALVQK
jgi:uncharacterized HAD superfamily protein